MSEGSNIVPFGKYKDQPVERLLADRQYAEWLLMQSWFAERYVEIYNLVSGLQSKESNETPEHNKIQLLFLDEEFRRKFLIAVGIKIDPSHLPEFEYCLRGDRVNARRPPVDVLLYDGIFNYVGIEIKPTMSDDYPVVLRQMKSNNAKILLLRDYTGVSASLEQLSAFFASAKIQIVFLSEIE